MWNNPVILLTLSRDSTLWKDPAVNIEAYVVYSMGPHIYNIISLHLIWGYSILDTKSRHSDFAEFLLIDSSDLADLAS
jgi:hypothetical protein